jgi:hypothetical protein
VTLLIILLIILLIGGYPRWPHSKNWGYLPSGSAGLILLLVVLLMLSGNI